MKLAIVYSSLTVVVQYSQRWKLNQISCSLNKMMIAVQCQVSLAFAISNHGLSIPH